MSAQSKLCEARQKNIGFLSAIESDNSNYLEISFEEALLLCRKHISKYITQMCHNKESKEKEELTEKYIGDFVDEKSPNVQGYTTPSSLKDALRDEIDHYGPITEALRDPWVDKIHANAPNQIFVEMDGKMFRYKKKFTDRAHMEQILSKLLGDSSARLTPKSPFAQTRTMEGYHINATHAAVSPYGAPAFVVRKTNQRKVTADAMLRQQCFSKQMLLLLSLIPKAGASWLTAGCAASGKTTLNELMARQIHPLSRVITVEKPSEMRLLRYAEGGASDEVLNDIVQYEADQSDDAAERLLRNAARQSPQWLGAGELCAPGEFAAVLQAALAGCHFFSTVQTADDRMAVSRFLTAYLKTTAEPAEVALRNICETLSFVIVWERFPDGTRKITKITEVLGAEGLEPILNPIYEFVCEDVTEADAKTRQPLRVIGRHKRVGALSPAMCQKMLKAGIKRSAFDCFTKPIPAFGEDDEKRE